MAKFISLVLSCALIGSFAHAKEVEIAEVKYEKKYSDLDLRVTPEMIDKIEDEKKSKLQELKAKWENLDAEQKMLVSNGAVVGLVAIIGITSWDYGSKGFHTRSEGYFSDDTRYGGVDKLGHAYTSYTYAEAMAHFYKKWGVKEKKIPLYSSLSSWLVMLAMEIGDASSADHGYATEDVVANTVGVLFSYFLQKHPSLREKLAFRLQYSPKKFSDIALTDYENQRYFFIVKLAGFTKKLESEKARNFFDPIELFVSYEGRNFSPRSDERERIVSVGVSYNIFKALGLDRKSYKDRVKEDPSKQSNVQDFISVFSEYFEVPVYHTKLWSDSL